MSAPSPKDRLSGEIAYALTKRLVIDMPTARAAVDDALRSMEKNEDYKSLVMEAFDRFGVEDRRELIERKTESHFKAKQRL
ncbi:hypothetical protein [Pelagibacterium lentulum]|uniref:Uncharacterized protein n=1 Tax=Pelagibacterium lentulum TaxID=2029865 RepID=A0A916W433_9HYPH|nr:hypothetical protein [Pelagibacterium lentulum]GGA64623.1 hypothetical protein GCM10011499_38860 [Pelagibacterium lentulum]